MLGMPVPIDVTCPTDLGQHPLTREAQTREATVEVVQDQQVLVSLNQFGRGYHVVFNWKAQGPLLVSVTPCWGSALAELYTGDSSQWGPTWSHSTAISIA